MRTRLLSLMAVILSMGLWSCNDQCKETRVTRRQIPFTRTLADIRASVKIESPHEMKRPGKLYTKGKYLFINEIKQGIHVIDNSNPSSPAFVSFIAIPGNGDLAVKGNTLYADSYTDLVAIDISDPTKAKEVGRVQNVFQNGQFDGAWWNINAVNGSVWDSEDATIQDFTVDYVEETITTNCEDTTPYPYYFNSVNSFWDMASFGTSASAASSSPNSAPGTSGKAGSMARFALNNDFLYTVSLTSLHLFDISKPTAPTTSGEINVGRNIETIFPYENKLFIGSANGMFIYDNADPKNPKQLSVFQHGTACDPVVVANDIAYVTLRTGTACWGTQNQMDLVDVSDASSPKLIKTYQMQNPHGLSVDFPTLYLCEGDFGLRIFDVTDKMGIDKNMLSTFSNIHAYDVITMGKNLLVIGKDGFYQYDASDVKDVKLLSRILVKK
ncbi:LVIVD repeat-containing protein [Dyadobacter sp. CY312]|uniref:LVIVD repeat-containing protein n=1 Tax=Dyadobacter sp. CY312 TaxID=2907303 RepID=UPI001F170674|nr:hypothetical protein [Dyadobacter sp. CY312]MCE7042129.1 hypothetical protein [Dyadobacter sp. CY312]